MIRGLSKEGLSCWYSKTQDSRRTAVFPKGSGNILTDDVVRSGLAFSVAKVKQTKKIPPEAFSVSNLGRFIEVPQNDSFLHGAF